MADVRALMAQERQNRRINHEFATYTKSGALMCTACQLNIKAETLWEGHLRSTNHKANAKKAHQAPRVVVKRKLEDVEEEQSTEDVDARKKLKPRTRNPSETTQRVSEDKTISLDRTGNADGRVEAAQSKSEEDLDATARNETPANTGPTAVAVAPESGTEIDEDEWAAFQREVAALEQPNYASATITAAPVTAAQLEAEAESDRKRLRDTEAEDEKEDEGRRMEEEFDVMEEMEERVRKLREKREALRSLNAGGMDTGQSDTGPDAEEGSPLPESADLINDSDEEVDDWYS